jgi:hypothetical protein
MTKDPTTVDDLQYIPRKTLVEHGNPFRVLNFEMVEGQFGPQTKVYVNILGTEIHGYTFLPENDVRTEKLQKACVGQYGVYLKMKEFLGDNGKCRSFLDIVKCGAEVQFTQDDMFDRETFEPSPF